MARVTVEDCITKIPNRFDLVVFAAQRTRQLSSGAPLTLDRDNDKNPVVALREIAAETIVLRELADATIQSHRQYQAKKDEQEDEMEALLAEDKASQSKNIEIGSADEKIPADIQSSLKEATASKEQE